ncbi:Receptor-type tyrosine-protein phosphatase [Hondaea fermentalgiana]|uniref:Receptor-type tyrosine-protein phosphatase n=1 Tax=Hondaea fermentalgiana TaxID=2315210 RepID=A0A2R5GJ34_9STRA|nr:Receptor-type tyrosine-protein phosphatase [Hondaea fermentalgiana]|eukprot:GBG30625.1 Receptor-type tyrosine-protein phosphatase [Hondaea fermentalgiana]
MANDDDGGKPKSLYVLTAFSYITILAAILNGVGYGLGLAGAARMFSSDAGEAWFLFLLNLYGLLFAISLFFIEIRFKDFYVHFPGFKFWVVRGLYIVFIGILSLAVSSNTNPFDAGTTGYDFWETMRKAFAYALVVIGLLYVLGEILCVRKHMQKVKSKYVEDGKLIESSLVACGREAQVLYGRRQGGPSISTMSTSLGKLLKAACKDRDPECVEAEYEALGAGSPFKEDFSGRRSHKMMMREGLCSVADAHSNENRFCNILPFDACLAPTGEEDTFANASLVSPLMSRFIIAQGPLERPDTRHAFWKVAIENGVTLMVNLAPIPRECADYVSPGTYKDVNVEVVAEEVDQEFGGDVVVRKLCVTRADAEPALISHIQFNAWPNYGTPESMAPTTRVVARALEAPGLVMVNCSGGVGRSGTFVSTLAVLSHLRKEQQAGNLDRFMSEDDAAKNSVAFGSYLVSTVKSAIETIREQRHPWMVEGAHQYALIFQILHAVADDL